jgi:hypothetical protein
MSTKKKQKLAPMSEVEYIATFCQEKRVRNRYAVYISQETHRKLMKAVYTFQSDYYVTAISMTEAIISHHFEMNGELLDRLFTEVIEKDLKPCRRPDNESDYEDELD